ncbi:hypothetical protein BDF22DRAFT_694291 [Syncephalis plumigaleata]|nr:hypothetical protein BDF22DRAFT_694291 [Syncephalis plumigaleata]
MEYASLVWLVGTGSMIALVLLSWLFTKYYQDPAESESHVTVVTVVGLTFCLFILTLAPLDIFLVSSTVDLTTGLKQPWATPEHIDKFLTTLSIVYYACFAGIVILCFVVIPFAYFYYEELDHDEPTPRRAVSAAKYTTFTVCIAVILLLSGMALRPKLNGENPHMDFDWFKRLLLANGGVKAIMFVVAVLILAGMMVVITYTAYGLSVLPLRLLRGRYVRKQTRAEIDASIERVRSKRRAIQRKYENATRAISTSDGKMLMDLEQLEIKLARQQAFSSDGEHGFTSLPARLLRVFELILGIVCLIITMGLVASILFSCIDKVKNSVCGKECGYIISHPEWFNPVNVMLLSLNKHFPADYLFVVLLVLYFFAATTTGLVQAGVRFFWVYLYRIKAHRTAPQGLLLSAILLMVSLLALNYTMTTVVAPQYTQFGSQHYCNHTIATGVRDCTDYPQLIIPCDVEGPVDICTPTVLSTFIYRIIVSLPTMGILFFNAQWVFLATFGLGLLYRIMRDHITCGRPEASSDGEEERLLGSA